VITGFNTDIEHDGVIYHVQTEDKGLDSPIILSLVYAGGTILAAKRSPYKDLIEAGFSDEALGERLKRQHRLICAAIHSGRINDLKKMGERRLGAPEVEGLVVPDEAKPIEAEVIEAKADHVELVEAEPVGAERVQDQPVEAEVVSSESTDVESAETVPLEIETTHTEVVEIESTEAEPFEIVPFEIDSFQAEYLPYEAASHVREVETPVEEIRPPIASEEEPGRVGESETPHLEDETLFEAPLIEASSVDGAIVIALLDDEEFYSGSTHTLRVLVTNRSGAHEKPLGSVPVSIKILGTTFRPLLYSVKTEKDGVAIVSTEIPEFTSGRAAVLIRAVMKDQATELRRIIHPGR
jgi:hypothetical protein